MQKLRQAKQVLRIRPADFWKMAQGFEEIPVEVRHDSVSRCCPPPLLIFLLRFVSPLFLPSFFFPAFHFYFLARLIW